LLRRHGQTVVMDVHGVYQYSELKEKDAIRLIHLQPCEDLEMGVECYLKDATLAEYRNDIGDYYIALSYAWGDQSDTRSISVNGKRLEITASLDSALRHIRDHRRVLHIWADGVCINQKNTHDRNRQVRLMGDIYSSALYTVIFLGLSSPQCDSVMQLMASATQPSIGGKEGSDITFGNLLDGREAIVEEEILSRPWFTRVWILQELVLSQNPWIQLGKFRIKWLPFCRSILSSKSSLWRPESRAVLKHMSEFRTKFVVTSQSNSEAPQEVPGETLFDLLQKRKDCGLSNPRDLIYAHLGLIDAGTRKMVPIDYDKTIAQVYEDMTRLYLQWLGVKAMVSLLVQDKTERRPPSLPSWVLDWSSQFQLSGSLLGFKDSSGLGPPRILYQMHQRVKDRGLVSVDVPHIMAICGWHKGTIESIIPMSSLPKKISGAFAQYDPLTDQTMILSLLDWVSRIDNEALHARRLLIAFITTIPPLEGDLETKTRIGWPNIGAPGGTRFTQIISIMSMWPEITSAMLATTDRTMFGFIGSKGRKESFIIRYIRILLAILQLHNDSGPMAALNTSLLVQVSSSARTGDYVADFHLTNDSFAILRPHDAILSKKEESSIRKDFERHNSVYSSCTLFQIADLLQLALNQWRRRIAITADVSARGTKCTVERIGAYLPSIEHHGGRLR